MADAQKVIATSGIIAVGVGTANSFVKNKQPPSYQFLLGSGVLYLILSALSEGEPELAKALAIAVMTTVVLGEGGGVLSYLDHRGETDTRKRTPNKPRPTHPVSGDNPDVYRLADGDRVVPFPGLPATP